jgi:sugar/nucleoside kinase (ribokinase family)
MPKNHPSPKYDLITFGDLCVDLVMSGPDVTPHFGQVEKLVRDYTLEMGGSCSIFACQAARLGLRTAILGRVGEDDFGRLILRRLSEAGVDTSHVSVDPGLKTGLGVALCPPGDRAILTYLGTIDAVRPEDARDDLLASTRHLHHGSFYLQTRLRPAIPEIFRRARSLGLSTSLDTNWDPEEVWNGGLEKILPWTTIFMPNDRESLRISRRESLEAAAEYFLRQGVQIVTIKAGPKGAQTFTRQGVHTQHVTPVSGGDSIGAGDSFDAGFLAGWLKGLPLERCLAIASACGRSVASQAGGLAGQLSWEQASQT